MLLQYCRLVTLHFCVGDKSKLSDVDRVVLVFPTQKYGVTGARSCRVKGTAGRSRKPAAASSRYMAPRASLLASK